MKRNLKALGLALMAIFAMSALAATSASAEGKKITTTSGPYPKHLIGEDVGAADVFKVGNNEISCHGETYSATLNEATNTIEAAPEYHETCQTVGSGWNVTVTENGCTLHFTTTENVATDHDKVTPEVKCPGKNEIEIHHYTSSSHGSLACTNTVHPQMTEGTLTATSLTASGDILLEGIVKLKDTTHGACSFGFTLTQNAEFIATTTIKDKAGTRIHIG